MVDIGTIRESHTLGGLVRIQTQMGMAVESQMEMRLEVRA